MIYGFAVTNYLCMKISMLKMSGKNAKWNNKIFKHLRGKIFQTQLDFAFLRTCVCSFVILLKTYVFHFFIFAFSVQIRFFSANVVKLQNGNFQFLNGCIFKISQSILICKGIYKHLQKNSKSMVQRLQRSDRRKDFKSYGSVKFDI